MGSFTLVKRLTLVRGPRQCQPVTLGDTVSKSIDNTDDIIDSRDVIARIEELAERLEGNDDPEAEPLDDDEKEELATLRSLEDQCKGYCADWEHGATLIRQSHFRFYAQELAEECGLLDTGAKWPMTCIDWDEAARELAMDYTEVDFDGVSYYVR